MSGVAWTKEPVKFADDWTWTFDTTQLRKAATALAYQPNGTLVAVGSEGMAPSGSTKPKRESSPKRSWFPVPLSSWHGTPTESIWW